MLGLGMSEVLLIGLIGLLLFGNKLPQLARSLGKTFAVFKAEVDGVREGVNGLP